MADLPSLSNQLDELKRTNGVTLDDVSRLAGVSAMTVSRAIHKPEKVSSCTLEKVQQAINSLGNMRLSWQHEIILPT